MPPEDEDHDQQGKINQRRGVDEIPVCEKADDNRERNGGDDRGERNVSADLEDNKPNKKNTGNGPRHETKEGAGGGRDAFAAFEPQPDREHVSGYRHDRGDDREILRVGLRRGPIFYQQKREPNRSEPFECIDREDGITPTFSQDAQHIRGADVSASDGTNINDGDAPREISRGKRSEKIADGAAG